MCLGPITTVAQDDSPPSLEPVSYTVVIVLDDHVPYAVYWVAVGELLESEWELLGDCNNKGISHEEFQAIECILAGSEKENEMNVRGREVDDILLITVHH